MVVRPKPRTTATADHEHMHDHVTCMLTFTLTCTCSWTCTAFARSGVRVDMPRLRSRGLRPQALRAGAPPGRVDHGHPLPVISSRLISFVPPGQSQAKQTSPNEDRSKLRLPRRHEKADHDYGHLIVYPGFPCNST
jgi:hypothetical protein